MEQERSDQSMQNVLDFKCKVNLPTGEKSSALSPHPVQNTNTFEDQGLLNSIVIQTPTKTIEPLRRDALKDEARIVFDKCKTLTELFDRMDSSVRLLQLCKKLPTFQNICTQVEMLTKRKFSYCHLAQIKYILPEAVQIEKVLVHDGRTLCMKPDVKITLLFDALPAHPDQSASTAMRQVFRARLLDFFDTHPQECDIPEAKLPEIFNRTDISLPELLPMGSPKTSSPTPIEPKVLSNASRIAQSYSKCFSKKIISPKAEKTQLLASAVPFFSENSGSENNQYSGGSQEKESLASKSSSNKFPADPILSPQHSINSNACKSPLVRVISAADNMAVETPVQQTPKRLIPSTIDKIITETGEAQASSHSAAKRSLNFLALNDDVTNSSISLEDSKDGAMLKTCPQTAATEEILVKEDELRSHSALSRMEKGKEGHMVKGGKMSPKGSVQSWCTKLSGITVILLTEERLNNSLSFWKTWFQIGLSGSWCLVGISYIVSEKCLIWSPFVLGLLKPCRQLRSPGFGLIC
ncbi:hypothetical protein NE237_005818 [Protea cynaroides]|uniref:CDT1 Geminin-binding domain-containing protein n=1 Tax=Protea cynaroides TaxID=273540 RepID=A0A9Q0QUZ0_9MAGN|nr:hypothetical protein NE237_005818 [Protea cynaroides]